MKIVVIGGSGLIGTKLVDNLRQPGHEVVAASLSSGVNILTGEGLAQALTGAQVAVDVANSPSFEDKAVLEFFETAGRNLLAAEAAAGVACSAFRPTLRLSNSPERRSGPCEPTASYCITGSNAAPGSYISASRAKDTIARREAGNGEDSASQLDTVGEFPNF